MTQDWAANQGNPKFQVFLLFFRSCQFARRLTRRTPLRFSIELTYRLVSEVAFGLELPLRADVGPELKIFHGFGLVVNDKVRLGRGVTLRNGCVVGNRVAGGPVPKIDDFVDVGAAAVILGDVTIGKNARIGAGSVVVHDIPEGAVVHGPAATIPR